MPIKIIFSQYPRRYSVRWVDEWFFRVEQVLQGEDVVLLVLWTYGDLVGDRMALHLPLSG